MGLIEALLDNVSIKGAVFLLPGLLLAYVFYGMVLWPMFQETRLLRLPGSRAPGLPSVMPFCE